MEQPKGSALVRVAASAKFGDDPFDAFIVGERPMFSCRQLAAALGHKNADQVAKAMPGNADYRRDVHFVTITGEALRSLKRSRPDLVSRFAASFVLLTERGVYRVLMLSRMPKAVEFQDWLEEEVLPQIRATGSYQAPPADPTLFDDRTEPRVSAPKRLPPPPPPQLPAVRDPSRPGDQLRHRIRVAVVDAPLRVVVAMYEVLLAAD